MMPKHVRSFQVSSSAMLKSCTEGKSDHNIKELRSEDEWHRKAFKDLAKELDILVVDCYKSNLINPILNNSHILINLNFYSALEKLENKKSELLEDEKKNASLELQFKKGFVDWNAREMRSINRLISQAEIRNI